MDKHVIERMQKQAAMTPADALRDSLERMDAEVRLVAGNALFAPHERARLAQIGLSVRRVGQDALDRAAREAARPDWGESQLPAGDRMEGRT